MDDSREEGDDCVKIFACSNTSHVLLGNDTDCTIVKILFLLSVWEARTIRVTGQEAKS